MALISLYRGLYHIPLFLPCLFVLVNLSFLQSETTTTIQLGGKRKKLEVSNVFNQDEDEENNDNSRKLKLSLPSAEDKRVSFFNFTITLE